MGVEGDLKLTKGDTQPTQGVEGGLPIANAGRIPDSGPSAVPSPKRGTKSQCGGTGNAIQGASGKYLSCMKII